MPLLIRGGKWGNATFDKFRAENTMGDAIKLNWNAERSLGDQIEPDTIPIIMSGRSVNIARVEEEWLYDLNYPYALIEELIGYRPKVDLLTFKQRIPNFRPKYPYYFEWENSAVLTISSYEDWFANQLATNSRNKVRMSEKRGVSVSECSFDDDFIGKVLQIYNETRIRQGKKFQHYEIDFNSLKRAHSTFLDKAVFLGAFWRGELIGFVKLVNAGSFVRTMGILAKVKHRDKAPMNILISEAVRYCASKNVKYFVYGEYDYGKVGSDSIRDFKRFHGFEGILLPRYYVPFTLIGKVYLYLKLQHGIVGLMPRPLVRWILNVRKAYYRRLSNRRSDTEEY